MLALPFNGAEAKDLVVYFSATGTTQSVAEEIAQQTGADILRIEAAEPYAANPYDDSNRIQDESYNDRRPGVANLPTADFMAQYDRIFVGSPIWWHQPAMVVCTFLEAFDLSDKTIVPFFTYAATTYLNESMHKIYKLTPNSHHVPESLPEDLNPDDITTPGPADDNGIDMPGSARGVKDWLNRLGLMDNSTAIGADIKNSDAPFTINCSGSTLQINVMEQTANNNIIKVYNQDGSLVERLSGESKYTITLPHPSIYVIAIDDIIANKQYCKKINVK